MILTSSNASQRSIADFDEPSRYQTQFEFMSVAERLRRINDRIQNFKNKNTPESKPVERCSMVHFSVEEKRVTEARHLIISLCKDKLVFLRIKPILHSNLMQVELFVKESAVACVKEIMKSRFHC
jgi:hypothetical protein